MHGLRQKKKPLQVKAKEFRQELHITEVNHAVIITPENYMDKMNFLLCLALITGKTCFASCYKDACISKKEGLSMSCLHLRSTS
jgi:hypothetical protein